MDKQYQHRKKFIKEKVVEFIAKGESSDKALALAYDAWLTEFYKPLPEKADSINS